jgi:hypothetical protein
MPYLGERVFRNGQDGEALHDAIRGTRAPKMSPFARSLLGVAVFAVVALLILISLVFDSNGDRMALFLGVVAVVASIAMAGLAGLSAVRSAKKASQAARQ